MIVNPRTLRAMQKAGFILWPDIVEKHWTGQRIRSRWVWRGPRIGDDDAFVYRGVRYRLRYVDGCIHPFVFRDGVNPPSFV